MNHNNNAKRNTKSSDASHDVPRRIESRRLLPEALPNQIRSNVGEAGLDASLDQPKPPRDSNNAIAHHDPAVPTLCAPDGGGALDIGDHNCLLAITTFGPSADW